MAQNENKAFVMYDSFIQAMRNLNGDDFKECVLAMADYAIDGIEPTSENPMINIILTMAMPNIEAAQRRHLQAVENGSKGKEFGKQGGRPRKGETAEQYHQRKLEENPEKPLKKEIKEKNKKEFEIKSKTQIDNKVDKGGLDNPGLKEEKNFSFSSPLQGANNLNGQQASTGIEIKPVNGQQDAKHINSQPIGNTGLEQAEKENKTTISTPVQGQSDREYKTRLYNVAAQVYSDALANYATVLSTLEGFCSTAMEIINNSGQYLFGQFQHLQDDDGQERQTFERIVNVLAEYNPRSKKVIEDVFRYLLRREYKERRRNQEQSLNYDEVYG